ncbi:MAG: heparinase II/III family protein [Planctomycetota bacterium]
MRRLLTVALLCSAVACWSYDRLPPMKALYETSLEEGDKLPSGWSIDFGTDENFEWAATPARTGGRSVHIIDRSETKAAGLRSRKIPVHPGERVWLSGWFLTKEGGGASMYFEYWDARGRRMDKEVKSFAVRSNGEWQRTRKQDTAPDGTTHVTILLYSSTQNTCDGYFDDIALGTGFQPTHDRTPLPPATVKHPCGPYSLADVHRAKANIEKHEWARKILDGFKRSSKFWMDMPDEQIKDWVPDLTPFRVVDCPNCDALWAICWKHLGGGRFQCRKCGTEYPNEKFPETKTEILLSPTGNLIPHPYYESPKGKKHRLSGYERYVRIGELGSLGQMGRYYALTGDKTYAEKAVKVMRRLAEVYPDYVPHDWYNIYEDYSNTQSGKMSGWKLHDCTTMLEICLCYDLIYDSGALTEKDKIAIENNVFRELGEFLLPIPQRGCCINDGPFQMSAAAYLGVLLGDHRLVKWAVEPPGGFMGFVRDYFFRDGHWEDGSPAYEAMALSRFYVLPEILQGYSDPPEYKGRDRYDKLDVLADPLIRKIHIAPLFNMFPDRSLPPINDGGKPCHYSKTHAEVNHFWYPSQEGLEILNWVYDGKLDETGSEYALWRRDPNQDFGKVKQRCLSDKSVLRPGLGWAILREGEGKDRTDLVLDYGEPCGWHGHPDRLNFILWANGREVVTDLGYLGARHHFRPWMAHGVCHNLVMVDGKDQARQPGKLILFQPGERVQAVVAEAPKTYPQCSRYERSMLLITPSPGVQYVVDVFRVAGGGQHDFAFHGDGAVFECSALADARPYQGEVGPKEGGYDWLEGVRSVPAKGQIVADWRFGEQDAEAATVGVRLRMINVSGALINGKGPNLRNRSTPYLKPMLDYVIQRRTGPTNTFVSVIEPVRGKPIVAAAELLPLAKDAEFETIAVKVTHPEGADYVIVASDANRRTALAPDAGTAIELFGRLGVVSFDSDGDTRFLWLADGASIRCNNMKIETSGAFAGRIVDYDEKRSTFTVDAKLPDGLGLSGQPIIAQNRVDGAYTVDRVESAGDGSVVHLTYEPIMKVEKGEAFRLPTYGLLWRGPATAQTASYRFALSTPGTVTAEKPRKLAYLQSGTGPWKAIRMEGGSVRLGPGDLDPVCSRLTFADRPLPIKDVNPPEIQSISPEPQGRESGRYVFGFLKRPEIRIALADPSGVGSACAWLRGEHTGRVPVSADTDGSSVVIRTGDLPEDDFELLLAFSDQLGNDGRAAIEFQTRGIAKNFTDMKIVEDSGQDSKPLPTLETQFYRGKQPGDFVVYEFEVEEGGEYEIRLVYTQAQSYGAWQFSIDSVKMGKPVDGYAEDVIALGGRADLGTVNLASGAHRIRVEVAGKNEKASACLIGLGKLILKPK